MNKNEIIEIFKVPVSPASGAAEYSTKKKKKKKKEALQVENKANKMLLGRLLNCSSRCQVNLSLVGEQFAKKLILFSVSKLTQLALHYVMYSEKLKFL